jgi:hypothetical protein
MISTIMADNDIRIIVALTDWNRLERLEAV